MPTTVRRIGGINYRLTRPQPSAGRRRYRRRRGKNGLYKRGRGMSMTVMPFKREISSILDCSSTDSLSALGLVACTDGSGDVTGRTAFQFDEMVNPTEFLLYKFYKINLIIMKLYPLYTVSMPAYGQNLFVQISPNHGGDAPSASSTQNLWDQVIAKRVSIFNTIKQKAYTIKIRPTIERHAGPVAATDLVVGRPGYFAMTNQDVPHFGVNLRLGHVDASTSMNSVKFRVVRTFYFQCKGVQ